MDILLFKGLASPNGSDLIASNPRASCHYVEALPQPETVGVRAETAGVRAA